MRTLGRAGTWLGRSVCLVLGAMSLSCCSKPSDTSSGEVKRAERSEGDPTPTPALVSSAVEPPEGPARETVVREGACSGSVEAQRFIGGFGPDLNFPETVVRQLFFGKQDGGSSRIARGPDELWFERTWDDGGPTVARFRVSNGATAGCKLIFVDGFIESFDVPPDNVGMHLGRRVIKEGDNRFQLHLDAWLLDEKSHTVTQPATGRILRAVTVEPKGEDRYGLLGPCPKDGAICLYIGDPLGVCKAVSNADLVYELRWILPTGCIRR